MTLLKDLIEIPEHLQRGDFVLRLAEDINRPELVLDNYVVTPELKICFDDALSFIRSSLQGRTSKASYLHGSFGSGKSHFMAVLHLILQGNAAARGIPELASVIQKHNEWIAGKKFLLVPYHMIGAHDMESGILGGYVDFIRRVHPKAAIPGVYLAEGLFRDAQDLRARMGDAAFFAALSEDAGDSGGWGELEAGWDTLRFEEAVDAEPGSEARSQLISALIGKFFKSYDTQVGGRGESFVPLDTGLSVLSKHAGQLGYDALILFLDELILWLASHAADLRFVHQEGQKLAKLVEAQTPDRPVPVISFIARQRDLRELVGDAVPGADRLNFGDALRHWEGRFHKITLEDRNLPAIAEKRVLRPKGESARLELDAAFEQTAKIREAVMNVLLTGEGDRQMFRRVYPFSPALVQTLIAVSSMLQRERTALKVMVQLLVEQRETLQVGDIVPVGDLFDVVSHGEEAFSPETAIHFSNAKRLYHQRLLPVLEREHRMRREEIEQLPFDDPRRAGFRNDDRLVKTLLLSALVPEVESLRGLNAERLAALNHGTIKTPIAGREGQEVLRRCKTWAATVGEIRLTEDSNPTISVQLTGVDTDGIIKQAEREDNQGNRARRVRQMLFTQMGIEGEGEFQQHHDFVWRNTRRTCEVLFRNIRELPPSSLENTEDSWKLVIDFPFDEPGYGPKDDLSKIQGFKQLHPAGAKTLCWVPAFFSADAQKDLGLLVVLEHILTSPDESTMGERFLQFSRHLSPQDRQSAWTILQNQRSVLRQRVQNHLDAAYGLESISIGSLDSTHDLELGERFVSVWPGFDPRPPVAANLGQAMHGLLDQCLAYEFPAAPDFGADVKIGHLKKVWEQVEAATQAPDGRALIDKTLRPLLRQIANPLLLGEMGIDATHFVLGQHWRTHFLRKAAETGSALSVKQLRQWINDPRPMGLPKEAENLVILAFAAQNNYSFFIHNGPAEATLASIHDQCELRQQKLPDAAQWEQAVLRVDSIMGLRSVSRLLNASNVSAMATGVRQQVGERRTGVRSYALRLRERLERLGLATDKSNRMKTAAATLLLVDRMFDAEAGDVVQRLATAAIATSEAAMGECFKKATELEGNLDTANWDLFEAVAMLTDARQVAGAQVLAEVQQAVESDEHVIQLAPALKGAQAKALRLLTTEKPVPTKGSTEDPIPDLNKAQDTNKPTVGDGSRIVSQGAEQRLTAASVHELVKQLGGTLKKDQKLHFNVSWTIEEGGKSS